jgi:hypothetical protein
MNDLERDLRLLFRDQAASVDAPTLAPEPVLRRSKRRQMRTVVAGAAAAVIVLLAAVVAIGAIGNPTATVPTGHAAYGERTATIGGVAVTAPAGWTLIDDSPMARILPASSESCSFSGSGVPVAGPGASQAGSAAAGDTVEQPQQSCSTSPVAMPAGIPVLQLANFALPAVGFVCDVADIERANIPSDGAAAYVAAFPNGIKTADLDEACPGSEEIQTFADRDVTTVYAAVSVVGPDAPAEDAAAVRDFVHALGGARIVPSDPSTAGPGYVVAAGVDGGMPWRLEAGFISLESPDAPIGAILVMTDPDGHETSSVSPPSDRIAETDSQLADGTWLQWGTAGASVTDITSVAADGTRTEANLVPWPDGLRSFTDPTTLDGVIWEVRVPERGTLETGGSPTAASGQTSAERGDVAAASSTGDVHWRLGWTPSNCLELSVTSQLPGNTGQSGCIVPFDGSDPFIGGFYGQDDAVIAVVGPSGMKPIDNANCLDPMGSDGDWGGTSVCVLVIPVGSQATIGVRYENGALVNGVTTVQALPGSVHLVEGDGSSASAP